jgi:hypothetical protein
MLERKETKYGHSYRLDKKPVKGVTTLINAGFPKPALVNWAAKSVAEYVTDNFDLVRDVRAQGRSECLDLLKGAHYRDRDRAAARGTEVHALAEKIIHGQEAQVPEHLIHYVNGYVLWLDEWDVTPIVTEKVCANREHWYAGTFDAIIEFNAGQLAGSRFLVDWKTSRSVYGETAMQLAAYQHAEFYLSEEGGAEVPMPTVHGLGVVHITESGTDLYEVAAPLEAWDQFRHVMWVAKQTENIKTQINEPTLFKPEAVYEDE